MWVLQYQSLVLHPYFDIPLQVEAGGTFYALLMKKVLDILTRWG